MAAVTNNIIMSSYLLGFSRLSLAICLYNPLLLAGLLDYILCPYRTAVDKFLLARQHRHVRVKGSIEKESWDRPSFPAVSRMSCLSYFDGFRDGS